MIEQFKQEVLALLKKYPGIKGVTIRPVASYDILVETDSQPAPMPAQPVMPKMDFEVTETVLQVPVEAKRPRTQKMIDDEAALKLTMAALTKV